MADSYSPAEVFNFNEEIEVKQLIGNFSYGIDSFNNNIEEMKLKEKALVKGSTKIKNNINKRHKNNTYSRGGDLLSEKIDFYNYWIKILYTTHKFTLVVLCIIVFIMLVYKLINKSK
jgi:uncharacterized membrane protein